MNFWAQYLKIRLIQRFCSPSTLMIACVHRLVMCCELLLEKHWINNLVIRWMDSQTMLAET